MWTQSPIFYFRQPKLSTTRTGIEPVSLVSCFDGIYHSVTTISLTSVNVITSWSVLTNVVTHSYYGEPTLLLKTTVGFEPTMLVLQTKALNLLATQSCDEVKGQ